MLATATAQESSVLPLSNFSQACADSVHGARRSLGGSNQRGFFANMVTKVTALPFLRSGLQGSYSALVAGGATSMQRLWVHQ